MLPHAARLFAVLALGLALLAAHPAAEAGPLVGALPGIAARTVVEVQGYCGRQNFVCQRRFGGGGRYQQCMARRGCAVGGGGGGGRSAGGNRCEARERFCARRFPPGSRQFSGCVRRGGC